MKTIYALIAACLSLQACIEQGNLPIGSTNINEYSTAAELVQALSGNDADTLPTTAAKLEHPSEIGTFADDDDYTAGVAVATSLKIESTSVDTIAGFYDGWDYKGQPANLVLVDDDDYTATVILPKVEATSMDTDAAYYDGWDFKRPQAIDLHSIQANDWW
jgi:hypothetical protein